MCVGGPRHGDIVELVEGAWSYRVPFPTAPLCFDPWESAEPEFDVGEYTLDTLCAPPDRDDAYIPPLRVLRWCGKEWRPEKLAEARLQASIYRDPAGTEYLP